jgi:transcriptional regulator GlxA family with amidase domain
MMKSYSSEKIIRGQPFALAVEPAVQPHPTDPIRLGKLATLAGMSVSAYTRLFRETIGLSPLEYCIKLRLHMVRGLLLKSNLSLNDIAARTGFCDSNYMIKQFRLRQGGTPARLRKHLSE